MTDFVPLPATATAASQPLPPEARRFIVTLPEAPPSFPAEIIVDDAVTVHHLGVVCRAKTGERVALVDTAGEAVYAATILNSSRTSIVFQLDAPIETPASDLPNVILLAALVKEQRWDAILQKTTELGVRAIWPIQAERSIVKLSKDDAMRKQARWEGVLRAAAEQSEGLYVPQLQLPLPLAETFQTLDETVANNANQTMNPDNLLVLKILLMERGLDRQPLKTLCRGVKPKQPVVIAIGPEGGWTDAEAQAFQNAGFQFASYGSRILRSETAAMAAMAALLYESET